MREGARRLKQFGKNGSTVERGCDLPALIGLLEALKGDEEDNATKGKSLRRLALVEDAIEKLQEADEL